MGNSVTLLPESDDKTVCVYITGVINGEDFEKSFITPIKDVIAKQGHANLFAIYDDDYQGWDTPAAEASFNTFSELGIFARRIAYVNAPDSIHLIIKMMQPLMPNSDIRFFETDEKEEALAWAKGLSSL